jgi:carbamoyl-phosphate synthase large subunit
MSSPVNVLVTGVGAIIGQGIVKGLRAAGHSTRVFGVDRSDQSPGPYLCDAFRKKPPVEESSREYLDFWREFISFHSIDLILPGIESDVLFFNEHRSEISAAGSRLAINTPELISLCADKWAFGETLAAHGLPRIPTTLTTNWQEAQVALGAPPLILKPRSGNGSRGIARVFDEQDFDYWRAKAGHNWMLQRLIGTDDEEYTVGAFGLGNGFAISPIVFRRRLSAAGSTQSAEVIHDESILAATAQICLAFEPVGPTNLQFRKHEGECYLLEINPRFSSSASLRSAFGYNEAEMSLDYFFFDRPPKTPVLRRGKAWRFSEDFVKYDCDTV